MSSNRLRTAGPSHRTQTLRSVWRIPSFSICLVPVSSSLCFSCTQIPAVPQISHATFHRWASTRRSLCLECSSPVGCQENILENEACSIWWSPSRPLLQMPVLTALFHLCIHLCIIYALEMMDFALLWVWGTHRTGTVTFCNTSVKPSASIS